MAVLIIVLAIVIYTGSIQDRNLFAYRTQRITKKRFYTLQVTSFLIALTIICVILETQTI